VCKKAFAGRQCLAGVTDKDKDGFFDGHGRIAFKYGAYASVQLAVTKPQALHSQEFVLCRILELL